MNQIIVELWLWLGRLPKDEFESPSKMRSVRREIVEDGVTIRQLLCNLAKRYSPIAENVFDLKEKKLYPYVIINYNDHVISPYEVYDKLLKDGDKVTVLPMYMGG